MEIRCNFKATRLRSSSLGNPRFLIETPEFKGKTSANLMDAYGLTDNHCYYGVIYYHVTKSLNYIVDGIDILVYGFYNDNE